MSTRVVVASTAFGLATAVAAQRAQLFEPAGTTVLVCSNNAAVPEVAGDLRDVAGAADLMAGFDRVVSLNEALAPLHPMGWAPREADLPVWERYLRLAWGLGDDELALVLESVQADPALALCRVFANARIDVYADGLMSYGPTRVGLPASVAARMERLLHPDLVPGLSPLLLREHAVKPRLVPTDIFVETLVGPRSSAAQVKGSSVALLLGQYLAAAGILSQAEENDLHAQMLAGAVQAGHRRLEFKPHPSAPVGQADRLRTVAAELGATLEVAGGDELAEARFARGGIDLVVGCFSTALATARLFDLTTACVGTNLLLERLTPYENSNRIPVTLVRAGVPDLEDLAGCSDHRPPPSTEVALPDLVAFVAYCMQPSRNPDLRATAVRLLTDHPDEVRPYVKRRRLTSLDLPGRALRPVPRALRPLPVRLARRAAVLLEQHR